MFCNIVPAHTIAQRTVMHLQTSTLACADCAGIRYNLQNVFGYVLPQLFMNLIYRNEYWKCSFQMDETAVVSNEFFFFVCTSCWHRFIYLSKICVISYVKTLIQSSVRFNWEQNEKWPTDVYRKTKVRHVGFRNKKQSELFENYN